MFLIQQYFLNRKIGSCFDIMTSYNLMVKSRLISQINSSQYLKYINHFFCKTIFAMMTPKRWHISKLFGEKTWNLYIVQFTMLTMFYRRLPLTALWWAQFNFLIDVTFPKTWSPREVMLFRAFNLWRIKK